MPIPLISRLRPTEFIAIVFSFLLVGLEALIRILTLATPQFMVELFYRASRRVFNRYTSPEQREAENRKKSLTASVRDAADFGELCQLWGYQAEEHVVQTKDGYLLGVHRLQWRKGQEDQQVNHGPRSIRKPVVYMHHGLLMNSEVWVCLTNEQKCLPFSLVEQGYDVWLGNNRGNKYSKKAIHTSPTSTEFWDFSIDEFAFHDIPDSIHYILDTTQQQSLSYIGFSQGTAQAFATLAIHPKLNDRVNVFIALAPAMAPAGLSNGVVDALMKASPQVLFLLFGRRSILSSATMWEALFYPPLFSRLIDMSLAFLFDWQTRNISASQKLAAYPHLYSFTSTKSVVHWFQIIRNKCFQMYDDHVHQPMSVSTTRRYSKVAKYPTRNIKTPIVLVYGGSDSLVDIKAMLKELPAQTVATEIPHYEHLDFLWARDVDKQVFKHVFDALESFVDAQHTKEEYDRYYTARSESLLDSANLIGLPGYGSLRRKGSESEASIITMNHDAPNSTSVDHQHRAREPESSLAAALSRARKAFYTSSPDTEFNDSTVDTRSARGNKEKKQKPDRTSDQTGTMNPRRPQANRVDSSPAQGGNSHRPRLPSASGSEQFKAEIAPSATVPPRTESAGQRAIQQAPHPSAVEGLNQQVEEEPPHWPMVTFTILPEGEHEKEVAQQAPHLYPVDPHADVLRRIGTGTYADVNTDAIGPLFKTDDGESSGDKKKRRKRGGKGRGHRGGGAGGGWGQNNR